MNAEDVNYWKTGQAAPDTLIDKAEKLIVEVSGTILGRGFVSSVGEAAYMLMFQIDDASYKIVWPVLHSRTGNQVAARRQAATMLFHDVKAKCMTAKVMGIKKAFFPYLLLPDGRTAAEIAVPELADSIELYLPQIISK